MEYLKYELDVLEPLKFSDVTKDVTNETSTLRYIPGSAIRGAVIALLIKAGYPMEGAKKILLLQRVLFLNAYLEDLETSSPLLPCPKGFVEEKLQDGKLKSSLIEETSAAYKRASLGDVCVLEKEKIRYQSVKCGEGLHVNIGQQLLFRGEYIEEGQPFCGYILLEDNEKELKELIINNLNGQMARLGAGKARGFGKVHFKSIQEEKELPWQQYRISKAPQCGSHLYMMLTSNTTMRNGQGELCGLDIERLGQLLGVNKLAIHKAATSVVRVSRLNRTWGSRTPEAVMYEMGSVFSLSWEGPISIENIHRMEESGIGIQKQEGCGRVLFLSHYEQIKEKGGLEISANTEKQDYPLSEEDQQVLLIAGKSILQKDLQQQETELLMKEPVKFQYATGNQMGMVLSICETLKYKPKDAKEKLLGYINHTSEKDENMKKQNESARNRSKFLKLIKEFLEKDYLALVHVAKDKKIVGIDILDLLPEEIKEKRKLQLLIEIMRYENRKERTNDQSRLHMD